MYNNFSGNLFFFFGKSKLIFEGYNLLWVSSNLQSHTATERQNGWPQLNYMIHMIQKYDNP
jgi:hypothetical protein